MEPVERTMTDDELFDALKHLAAMWFKNSDILILEELFRRYKRCQAQMKSSSNLTNPS